jgi:hypothetical protein
MLPVAIGVAFQLVVELNDEMALRPGDLPFAEFKPTAV